MSGGRYAAKNPMKKIRLAIQQIGNQLFIFPHVHHSVVQVGIPSVTEGAGITVLPTGIIDSGTNSTLPMAEAVPAQASAAGSSMATHFYSHTLFLQQLITQQWVEDLRQELINKFTNQQQYMQHMNRGIGGIAIQPVYCPEVWVGGELLGVQEGKQW